MHQLEWDREVALRLGIAVPGKEFVAVKGGLPPEVGAGVVLHEDPVHAHALERPEVPPGGVHLHVGHEHIVLVMVVPHPQAGDHLPPPGELRDEVPVAVGHALIEAVRATVRDGTPGDADVRMDGRGRRVEGDPVGERVDHRIRIGPGHDLGHLAVELHVGPGNAQTGRRTLCTGRTGSGRPCPRGPDRRCAAPRRRRVGAGFASGAFPCTRQSPDWSHRRPPSDVAPRRSSRNTLDVCCPVPHARRSARWVVK